MLLARALRQETGGAVVDSHREEAGRGAVAGSHREDAAGKGAHKNHNRENLLAKAHKNPDFVLGKTGIGTRKIGN